MIKILFKNINKVDSLMCVKIVRLKHLRLIDWFMLFFPKLGNGYIYPVLGIFVLCFDYSKGKYLVMSGIIAFSIELTVYRLLKSIIKRTRPFETISEIRNLVKVPDRFSFPSGHTAAAFVMAVILSNFYPQLMVPLFLTASVIGFSRVYNGVHYLGDVFGGALIGIIISKFSLNIIAWSLL